MTVSLPFRIPKLVKSLPFCIPTSWKRHSFRAEPPHTPPRGRSLFALAWMSQNKVMQNNASNLTPSSKLDNVTKILAKTTCGKEAFVLRFSFVAYEFLSLLPFACLTLWEVWIVLLTGRISLWFCNVKRSKTENNGQKLALGGKRVMLDASAGALSEKSTW